MAANSQLASAVTNPLAAAQYANTYGPQTQQAIRRSQYLADALRQNLDGGQQIRGGWGELGARLLATAVLQRANDKGQDALIKALGADQQSETDRLLGGLGPAPGAAPPTFMPQAPPSAPQPQDPGMSAPSAQAPQPASAPNMSDADRLNIARAVYGEARGEPQAGQQAVASVILNRARASGKSPSDVVAAPHQFSGYNPQTQGLTPEQLQQISANIDPVLTGAAPDATNGADHFFNPALANPSWGQGNGQMIGQHKFMRLDDQGHAAPPQMAAAPPQPPPQAPPPEPQPYQVASNGPTPPPPQPPSAPGSSPPGAGTPAAAPPQAAAAAGTPTQPQWPTWKPSRDEYHYVQGLLTDPRTHAQGVQAAMQMRQKMTQPVEATVQTINGAPFYVAKDPTSGVPVAAIPVPREAMTQVMSAQGAGLQGAPQGLNVQRDPLGNLKDTPGAPPPGYQTDGQGGYAPIHNGPADPRREQPAPQGFRYADGGRQEVVPGSSADPRTGMNLAQGVLSFKKDLDPIVTNAMKVRQNFGAVVTGIHQQNGTGDIAAINGLQKLIDEGVVKGEDVTMQMKSNGLDGTLGGYLQYINSGGLLTPEVREKVAKTAGDLYHNLDQTYQARVMSMRPAVDQIYGDGAFDTYVFPKAMVDQMGWGASPSPAGGQQGAPAAAPQFKPGTQDAALAEAARRGLPLSPAQRARAAQLGIH